MRHLTLLLFGCSNPGAVSVVDARDGTPVVGVVLRATAADQPGCESSPTDAAGRAVVPSACVGGAWMLASRDPAWWAPEGVPARDGVTVPVWPVLPAGGIGLLDGRKLEPLVTNTAVDVGVLVDGAEVAWPIEIPATVPHLSEGQELVLDAEGLTIEALVPGAPREFGADSLPVSFGPWFYFAVRLDPVGPPVAVPTDLSRARNVTGTDRQVRYVSVGDLAPGRYGVLTENRRRAVLFEVSPR